MASEGENEGSGTRPKVFTEKGLEYQIEIKSGLYRNAVTKWRSQAGIVDDAIRECDNVDILKHLHQTLGECFDTVVAMAHGILELGPKVSLPVDIQTIKNDHRQLEVRVKEAIIGLDCETQSQTSYRSKQSSKRSEKSVTSLKAEAAAQAAELEVKADALKKEHTLLASMEEKKRELETHKLQTKLEIAKARFKAVSEAEVESVVDEALASLPRDDGLSRYLLDTNREAPVAPGMGAPTNAHNRIPMRQNEHFRANFDSYAPRANFDSYAPRAPSGENSESGILKLVEQLYVSRIPIPEPAVFTGNPLEYAGWKSSFETLIERRGIPPSEKIHYLKRYLGGKARECVEGYFLLSTEQAFEDAKQRLNARFGNPFLIGNAFRDKLEGWPKVSNRDREGLRKFSDFLTQCECAMSSVNLNILNDDRQIHKLQQKLPDWMANKWARVVWDHQTQFYSFPSFSVFVNFVVKEVDILCNPSTLLHVSKDTSQVNSKRSHVFLSDARENQRSYGKEKQSNKQKIPSSLPPCLHCKGNHHVDYCKRFIELGLGDKRKIVKDNRLCFSCLRPNHISKECPRPLSCRVCNAKHPTSMHENRTMGAPKEPEPEASTSHATRHSGIGGGSKSSMILPVYVSNSKNPAREVLVYALLDTQSDTTFVTESACDSLGVTGDNVKLSLSTMSSANEIISTRKVKNLFVRGYRGGDEIELPPAYTRPSIPTNRDHIPTPDTARKWPHLVQMAENLSPLLDVEVGLLIGYNCSRALVPRAIIPPVNDGPFAQKTDLGWGIIGIVNQNENSSRTCHRAAVSEVSLKTVGGASSLVGRVRAKEIINPDDISKLVDHGFACQQDQGDQRVSFNDRKFIKQLESGIVTTDDGHYEMPLPFKCDNPVLPCNKGLAVKRLEYLKRRLDKDIKYKTDYCNFMNETIKQGFAEQVSDEPNPGKKWYIPHHGVYHPKKPDKIRVVFDCSASQNGISLNHLLLQGPDMTNALLGVLCRFRKEPVAVSCDVEKMFYQFKVSKPHRDFLRFLWWENGDTSKEPCEYRMTVHLFGAVSSPGCSNFGLKRAAADGEGKFGSQAADFVRSDFYVDDGLTSVPTVESAVELVSNTRNLCANFGLRLHKFVSNSVEVLESIQPSERAETLKSLDLFSSDPAIERTLGIEWCVQLDCFQFKIVLRDRPPTRRGILSTVCSIYDPLGFLSPVILVGRQILQDICKGQFDWDSPLPEAIIVRWRQWCKGLAHLEKLKIKRCFKPDDFGEIKSVQLHHFCDASTVGYGQCSYLRLLDANGKIHCSLVMAKARVAPVKQITIPRLELSAAVLSVKVSTFLTKELKYSNIEEAFWTDSEVVRGYICNDAKRFHVFVANRVQQIRDHTEPNQWRHIRTSENPADYASRGLDAHEFMGKENWLKGPEFLWQPELPVSTELAPLVHNDPEVKAQSFAARSTPIFDVDCLRSFSDWYRAKRALANSLRYLQLLQNKQCNKISMELMCAAEQLIIRSTQNREFQNEIAVLQSCSTSPNQRLSKVSSLYKLDPYIDDKGILRVGGRLERADITMEERHPIILPKVSIVTSLLVKHFHELTCHQGRGITTNAIRQAGYWIVGCRGVVSSHIDKCVLCRRYRGSLQTQKMAPLPVDRVEPSPPFSYCAVDYFGPFYIKERRSELARYGVLFTCMASRAVHLESANSLSTDSFINALRRFIAIRGPIRQLRSDQGTNFVGAKRELAALDQDKINRFLLEKNCDGFEFKMNVPSASHMGGVWERQIRTVRNVLQHMLRQNGSQLDDESLRTFLTESAAIVNSRPLAPETLADGSGVEPLTPNHLLTMKSDVVLPPPGEFQSADMYCKRRWRRVQYLLNQFWTRWKREYMSTLQFRTKWARRERELAVGDVVLIKEENSPRNNWPLAIVIETMPSNDGIIRKVKVRQGDSGIDERGRRVRKLNVLERPIHKLVLIMKNDRGSSATGEQSTESLR